MAIRVLLVDDHAVFRDSLRGFVERDSSLAVVGATDNGSDAIRLCNELNPDVVLMDVTMPGMSGIEATGRIRAGGCKARIVLMTVDAHWHVVVEAFRVGASGFVVKSDLARDLPKAIPTVIAGDCYITRRINDSKFVEETHRSHLISALNARDWEIIGMSAKGHSSADIRSSLGLSSELAEVCNRRISSIMCKLSPNDHRFLSEYRVSSVQSEPEVSEPR